MASELGSRSVIARPKPPGRVPRRTSTVSVDSPDSSLVSATDVPPPYRSFDIDDALGTEADILGSPDVSQIDASWVQGLSSSELSRMLLKAEFIIQRRQRELTLAASIGKDLLDKNMELKTKYDALLERLPVSPSPSHPSKRPSKRVGSWTDDESEALAAPSFMVRRTSSDDSSTSTSTPKQKSALGLPRQPRHLSASPSAISFLYTQNESLVAQLSEIQEETAHAELHGKRNLKALEKEIAALKYELEASQKRTAELEEEIEERRKAERKAARDARLRDLRERLARNAERSSSSPLNFERTDFAPPSTPDFLRTSAPPTLVSRNPKYREEDDELFFGGSSSQHGSPATPAGSSPTPTQSPREVQVTAQLMQKIAELEDANRSLLSQHIERKSRLDRVTREAEALNSVYDTIERDEMIEEEIITRSTPEPPSIRGGRHQRHQSVYDTPNSAFKRRRGRPRSISITPTRGKGGQLHTPRSHRKKVRSALTPTTFDPLTPEGSMSDTPLRAKDKRHHRLSLQDELDDAWRHMGEDDAQEVFLTVPTLTIDHDADQDRGEESETSPPFPVTESQIDAAVLSMRASTRPGAARPMLPNIFLHPSPSVESLSGRSSPGPRLPGAFQESPVKSASHLPHTAPFERSQTPTPLARRKRSQSSLRKISSMVNLNASPSKLRRRRREGSARIEGLDLASQFAEDEMSSPGSGDIRLPGQALLPDALAKLLVEFWIFLQFCIVLVVFIYSVAKKGPRTVVNGSRSTR